MPFENKTWIIALSGGPDSMALWKAMLQIKSKKELIAVHVNHGLRGSESDADEAWTREQVEKEGLPFYSKKLNTAAIAEERKLGIEETARSLRYEFFLEIATKLKIEIIATAHHMDDQAETVFMRIVRGAGMDGLGGIPPINRQNGFCFVRPLIEISRAEIMAFLQTAEYRQDQTNGDTVYTRNFVRHELLPRIEKEWNPAVKRILARSAQQHREVCDFVEQEAKKLWSRGVRVCGSQIILKGQIFKKVHPFMRQEIIKKAFRCLAPKSAERFNGEHLSTASNMFHEKNKMRKKDFPDGITVERVEKNLVISTGGIV